MDGPAPPLLRTRRGLMSTAFPAVAVIAALGATLAFGHHDSVVDDRHQEARALASAAATNARRYVDDQWAVLSAVAAVPAVREGRARRVGAYLRDVADSAAFTAGIGVADREGRLVASSLPLPPGGVSLADRPYLQQALRTGRSTLSDVLIGRPEGRPVIAFAHPVASRGGTLNGFVIGSLRLDEVDDALKRLMYAPGADETLLDGQGRIVIGRDPPQGLRRPPAALPVAEMRRRGSGLLERVELAEGDALVAYDRVPGTPWLVVVEQDHGTVIGAVDTTLLLELAAIVLLAALGVAATMSVAARFDRLDAVREGALTEQRDIALRLQRSLLPDVPEPPGVELHASYVPAHGAMAVGGDWYDVVELADGRLVVSVGDVAGHGLAAAAAMGQLRSAARTLALGENAPAAALDRLGRFAEGLDGAPLATVVFATLDPAAGVLRYAAAGHPPPLVVRADGSTAFLQEGRSPLLGVDGPPERPEAGAALAPGDTLVLYTDGLFERPDSSFDAGLQRLEALAAREAARGPEALAAALIASVPEPRRDDTAVLCVRLAGAAQPSSVPS